MTLAEHEHWMRFAIAAAREGVAKGQSPFGAAVVRAGDLVSVGHNEVVSTPDPTAHAEVVAIRRAAAALGTFELSDCRIYSTCEPCPMCASAIHWAAIKELYFGASIDDARRAGFREIALTPEQVYARVDEEIKVQAGILQSECVLLFSDWGAMPDRVVY